MKRALLILCAVALIVAPSVKAQNSAGIPWTCGLDDVVDSPTLCIAAPEPGMRRYITDIAAQSTTALGAGLFEIQYNTAAALGGAANCHDGIDGTTIFPPGIDPLAGGRFAAAINTSKTTAVTFNQPLIVPAGKDLCVLGDGTNSVTIQLVGYTAP